MNYYLERIGQSIITVFSVITITFVIVRWMPGGPLDLVRAQLIQQAGSTAEDMQRVNELAQVYTNINPDKPLWKQYVEYMSSVVTGDLGKSIWFNEPVNKRLGAAIPWTVFISSFALVISWVSGVLLGAVMAYYEGSRFDAVTTTGLLWSHAIPYYVAAIVLIFFFGFQLEWFPTGGRMNPNTTPGLNWPFISGVINHAALPLFSLLLTGFGGPAISMRGNSIQVLGEDYLRGARLRGLGISRITSLYVARNAVLPLYTQMMIAIGTVLGGSIILEEIFSYPGVGYYMFRAINARDYPLMMGGFLLITIAVVIGLLVADLTYGWIDPRAKLGDDHAEY